MCHTCKRTATLQCSLENLKERKKPLASPRWVDNTFKLAGDLRTLMKIRVP
jgi:hypothetical protein